MSTDTVVVVTETTETIEVPGDTITVVEESVEVISDTTPATSAAASAAAAAASAVAAAVAVAAGVASGTLPASFTTLSASDNVVIAATKKLYLDGVGGVGGDSYIVESAANVVDHYAGAVKALSLSATGAALAAGTVVAPSLSFSTDTGSGLYRIGANNIGLAISGAKVLDVASTGLAVTGKLTATGAIALAAAQKLYLDGIAATGDTYLVESSANVLDFYAGGNRLLYLTSAGATVQYGLTVVGTTEGINQTFSSGTDENRLALAAATNFGSNNGAQTKWTLRWKGRGNGGTVGPAYTHFALYDELNSAYRLFVGYNGAIGVGHTAPTATMDIAGTFSLSSAGGVSPATYSAKALIASSSVDGDGSLSIANSTASAGGAGQRHGVILHGGSTAYGLASWVSSLVIEGQANGGVHIGAYATGAAIRLSVGNSRAALATLNATTFTLASAIDLVQAATKKHYLDGGGDTYLVESSANVLDLYAGGSKTLSLTATVAAVTGILTVSGDTRLATKTPASATATGVAGTVAWDANYLYACTATDTWKRAALATW